MNEFNRKYLNNKFSMLSIVQLLMFQFDNDVSKVIHFGKKIYAMCDFQQKDAKKNSLWVQSPNSAGKNYFFDALVDSFILVGQIKNPIRNYVFGFMNCVNKSFIMERGSSRSILL